MNDSWRLWAVERNAIVFVIIVFATATNETNEEWTKKNLKQCIEWKEGEKRKKHKSKKRQQREKELWLIAIKV